jgi:uncharacterized membrane protein
MNFQIAMIVLRVIHIVAGAFWVGAAITLARILLPALASVGPAAAPVMRDIVQRRRLPIQMTVAMALTILSGLGMMWHDQAVTGDAWAQTRMGMTFSAGAAVAVLGAIIGVTVSRPTATRLTVLGEMIAASAGPPSAELLADMQKLRTRLAAGTNWVAALVVLATAFMAVARYV